MYNVYIIRYQVVPSIHKNSRFKLYGSSPLVLHFYHLFTFSENLRCLIIMKYYHFYQWMLIEDQSFDNLMVPKFKSIQEKNILNHRVYFNNTSNNILMIFFYCCQTKFYFWMLYFIFLCFCIPDLQLKFNVFISFTVCIYFKHCKII